MMLGPTANRALGCVERSVPIIDGWLCRVSITDSSSAAWTIGEVLKLRKSHAPSRSIRLIWAKKSGVPPPISAPENASRAASRHRPSLGKTATRDGVTPAAPRLLPRVRNAAASA